jgi:hypothetical protein
MADVVTQLEKLFEEEKALKGDREEAGAGKKGAGAKKPSDRAQTARGHDDDAADDSDEPAAEEIRTGTWAGGRKGIALDDSPAVRPPARLACRVVSCRVRC